MAVLEIRLAGDALVVAGKSYQLVATVTNRSTLGGVGVGVNLDVVPTGVVGATQLAFSPTRASIYLGAYASQSTVLLFVVPAGTEGQVGRVDAYVFSPTGLMLANAYENLTVQAAPTAPVTIYFGLIYVPAPWDYYLPYWYDGKQFYTDPRGWLSIWSMAQFSNVPPGPGWFGFYLWASSTATTSAWYYANYDPVIVANGESWGYNFQTGALFRG